MKTQFVLINDGSKFYYKDREMTIFHREDGPAIEYVNGTKIWYIDGKCHREDGPAVEYVSDTRKWYKNGKLHREDGPAIEYADGCSHWYKNGKLHREDGPAIEYCGGEFWHIDGKELTKEEFNARMNSAAELTLDEIAAKFNVSVDRIKVRK